MKTTSWKVILEMLFVNIRRNYAIAKLQLLIVIQRVPDDMKFASIEALLYHFTFWHSLHTRRNPSTFLKKNFLTILLQTETPYHTTRESIGKVLDSFIPLPNFLQRATIPINFG